MENKILKMTRAEFDALENSGSQEGAKILWEDIYSSSQGSWGGETGVIAYARRGESGVIGIFYSSLVSNGYASDEENNRACEEADRLNAEGPSVLIIEGEGYPDMREKIIKEIQNEDTCLRVAGFLRI